MSNQKQHTHIKEPSWEPFKIETPSASDFRVLLSLKRSLTFKAGNSLQ
jgi:hypothetical protein